MHRPIRILHCADLHLGSDFTTWPQALAKQRKRELLGTFREIIQLCRSEEIDLLLIAGDLFEGSNVDRQTLQTVKQQLASISQTLIAIAPGNHDYMAIDSPYADDDWPPHVVIFRGQYETRLFPELGLVLSGAAFRGTYCQDSMLVVGQTSSKATSTEQAIANHTFVNPSSADHPETRAYSADYHTTNSSSFNLSPVKASDIDYPASNLSAVNPSDFIHIGVMHGDLVSMGGSSQYNPINEEAIAASGLDYLALGHIHQKSDVLRAGRTYYAYSGCPEGRGFDETGEKGVYIGTVDRHQAKLLFRPLCKRQYLTERLDISDLTTEDAIIDNLTAQLYDKFGKHMEQNLYKVTLAGHLPTDYFLDKAALEDRLNQPIYFLKLVDQTMVKTDYEEMAEEETLRGLFTSRLLKLIEAEKQPSANREIFEEALKIGLQAFESEVWLDED